MSRWIRIRRTSGDTPRSLATSVLLSLLAWFAAMAGPLGGMGRSSAEAAAPDDVPAAGQGSSADARLTADARPGADSQRARMLASPRATMRTLIESVSDSRPAQAAACLDLSGLDRTTIETAAPQLAARLKAIIERMWRVDLERVPDEPDFRKKYSLVWDADVVDAEDRSDAAEIVIGRGRDGLWRFTADTVAAVDRLWPRWGERRSTAATTAKDSEPPFASRLRELFPTRLREVRFLLPDYLWLSLAAILAVGIVADRAVRVSLQYITSAWFRFLRTDAELQARRDLWKPIGMLVQTMIWSGGMNVLGLPAGVLEALTVAVKFVAVVAAVWTSFRLIDVLAAYVAQKALATQTKFDDLLVPLLTKSLKMAASALGALVLAEAFSLPVTGLIGGLGLGGAALALASKDAIANLFGSVNLLADRPFEIGDWVVVEGVEGNVETVGFRSTRIRTPNNSLVTLPNSRLTTAVLDNLGRRRYRRVKMTLPLAYDTPPERIEAFCEGIRELIRRHPYTRKDYYHVYFHQFSATALDVLLDSFLDCQDLAVELRERHRLLVDVLRLAEGLRITFAAPPRPAQNAANVSKESQDDDARLLRADPPQAGRRRAAQIAGPPVPPEKRPGPVVFDGATPVD